MPWWREPPRARSIFFQKPMGLPSNKPRSGKKGILLLLFFLFPPPGVAQSSLPELRLVRVAQGFRQPVFVTHAGDGSGRLFIVEQDGIIRVLGPGESGPGKILLDIRNRVKAGGEMGLLSVAFHPRFKENGRFFVDYTAVSAGLETRISEFRLPAGQERADSSETVWLRFPQPYENHNGGLVLFGPDGYLYIGNGDGGSANDPENRAQNLGTLLGKILRVSVDGDSKKGFAIPPDNPFVNLPGILPEIYAFGLRNPWRFSFDRKTGELWAGDVGQDDREEIDRIVKGGNNGWRILEGTICTPGVRANCDSKGMVSPILDYGRQGGGSVTGGYVYRGKKFPSLIGVYFYGDFVSGRLWGLRYENGRLLAHRLLAETGLNIASFGEDEAGELDLVDYNGAIYRLEGI